jgi:type I restriction enzyme S subunit
MRSDWEVAHLRDLLAELIDHRGRTPKKLGGDFTLSGVRVISAKNVRDGRLDLSFEPRFVSEEMFARWMPEPLRRGDVLLTSEAPMGEAAYIGGEDRFCLGQRLFALRARSDRVCGRFLYYSLRSPAGQARLRARLSGTTAQGIRQSELVNIELSVPPLAEQQRIAGVLGALDAKIEHNRVVAKSCEAVADGYFDHLTSTCVDRTPLKNVAVVHKKSVAPTEHPELLFEHFSIPAFDDGLLPVVEHGASMLSAKTALPEGDIVLFSKLNPRTPRIWWPRPTGKHVAVCSPEFIVLAPRDSCPASFIYASLRRDRAFYDEILRHATGTTGSRQRVKPSEVLDCELLDAGPTWSAFDAVARPLYDRAATGLAESRTLAAIRDALLPKLVSGEIRVPESYDPDGVLGTVVEEATGATL